MSKVAKPHLLMSNSSPYPGPVFAEKRLIDSRFAMWKVLFLKSAAPPRSASRSIQPLPQHDDQSKPVLFLVSLKRREAPGAFTDSG